jgi:hypothetical protein
MKGEIQMDRCTFSYSLLNEIFDEVTVTTSHQSADMRSSTMSSKLQFLRTNVVKFCETAVGVFMAMHWNSFVGAVA